ncbi:TolC family protein [Flavobacteriaceae bacterium]|jgi:outer membrane protein TolC|nr:TolC family protein [Flavobacteriaceae bacterium]
MKHKILVISLVLYSLFLKSQDSFTLNEAVEFGLINNSIAKNATNDVKIANAKKWETIATGLPQINSFIEYNNNIKQPISLVPAEFFGGNPGEFSELSFGTKQTIDGSVTLTQLLFDGSYSVGLSSIKLYMDIAYKAKIKTDLEVKKSIISAYSNALVSEERVKILEKNLNNVKSNLDEIEKIYQSGLTEIENVEQLKITYVSIKNSLDYSYKLNKTSLNLLKLIIGYDIDKELILSNSLQDLTLKSILEKKSIENFEIDKNIDYLLALNNTKSQKTLLTLEKSKALPTLRAFIKGGYDGNNDSFRFFKSDQKWYGYSIAGVSMSVPIFSSLRKSAKTQQARIEFEKSKIDLSESKKRIIIELDNAESEYQYAVSSYNSNVENVKLAEKIERKNQIKFIEGLISGLDLRQAQIQLYSIQNQLIQSMLEVINKKTNLEGILTQN